MSWQSELDELRAREMLARQMGGADKVERQHSGGRLTVRERIDALVDAGTFHEVGAIAGRASYDAAGNLTALVPANCIFGRAQIDEDVLVGQDHPQLVGALGTEGGDQLRHVPSIAQPDVARPAGGMSLW